MSKFVATLVYDGGLTSKEVARADSLPELWRKLSSLSIFAEAEIDGELTAMGSYLEVACVEV